MQQNLYARKRFKKKKKKEKNVKFTPMYKN